MNKETNQGKERKMEINNQGVNKNQRDKIKERTNSKNGK